METSGSKSLWDKKAKTMHSVPVFRAHVGYLLYMVKHTSVTRVSHEVANYPAEVTVSYVVLSYRSSDMASDDKSTSSSSTLDWNSEPPLSPTSPSHLTHFKPLSPDQDEPPLRSAYSSLVSLFRFNKGDWWWFYKPSWEPFPLLIAASDGFRY